MLVILRFTLVIIETASIIHNLFSMFNEVLLHNWSEVNQVIYKNYLDVLDKQIFQHLMFILLVVQVNPHLLDFMAFEVFKCTFVSNWFSWIIIITVINFISIIVLQAYRCHRIITLHSKKLHIDIATSRSSALSVNVLLVFSCALSKWSTIFEYNIFTIFIIFVGSSSKVYCPFSNNICITIFTQIW